MQCLDTQESRATGGPGLTVTEDRELRQLTWFSRVGQPSEKAKARFSELLEIDRRTEVRDPRPNPSMEPEDQASTLPPLDMDGSWCTTCPNCGSALPRWGTNPTDAR